MGFRSIALQGSNDCQILINPEMDNRNSAMPYSPSPRPGQTATGSLNHILRHSPTPPLPPQTLSKQKKRRNALVERLEEISSNFALHRDDYYRKQLQTLQFDINYINRAQPYENAPLNDIHSDIFNEMISSLTANTGEAHRASAGGSRMPDMEVPPRAGIWASKYAQEINDAMEERDAQLTLVAVWINQLYIIRTVDEPLSDITDVGETQRRSR